MLLYKKLAMIEITTEKYEVKQRTICFLLIGSTNEVEGPFKKDREMEKEEAEKSHSQLRIQEDPDSFQSCQNTML